jgi:predicted Fe-Mo cluster-binding NifX family protein
MFNIVSVEQEEVEELQVYPNPVSHSATILGVNKNQQLRMFNTVGIEVTRNVVISNSPSNKSFVDMSQLPIGMYILVNGDESIRVLKQ